MDKKHVVSFAFAIVFLFSSCSNNEVVSSFVSQSASTSNHASSSIAGVSSSGQSGSQLSSSSCSDNSYLPKGVLATPQGLLMTKAGVLSWREVAGAINGYDVRLNGGDSVHVSITSINAFDVSYGFVFAEGENNFSVRASGTKSDFMSPYSSPVRFIKGYNENAVASFLSSVASIGEVTLESGSLIASAKDVYSTLGEIDLLLDEVQSSLNVLRSADGKYFLLLVKEAEETSDEDKKGTAVAYYSTLLDLKDESVIEAFRISFKNNVSWQQVNYEAKSTLYVYASGENIISKPITDLEPTLTVAGSMVQLNGIDGVYQADIEDNGIISFGGTEYEFAFVSRLEGSCFGVTDGAFGSNVIGADHFVVEVYPSSVVGEDFSLKGLPLTSLSVTNWNYSVKTIEKRLFEMGFAGENVKIRTLIYGIGASGEKSVVTEQSFSAEISIDVMKELTLSPYGSISVDGEGRLVWPWEIFMENANPEAAEVGLIEVYPVLSGSTFVMDDAKKFTIDYSGGDRFTYKADVESELASLSLTSGAYYFKARLMPNLTSTYAPSNFYPDTTSYSYEVK